MSVRYAIVDIETTGGLIRRDRITEVGIVLLEDHRVVDQFESLINPERSIPDMITKITGINDDMVAGAPKFFEVARDIVEFTEGCLFVAHNVDFDYRFIRAEYEHLGYTYTRKKLCTVKLARRYLPGLKSYSLGNLIRHYNIPVDRRHRALDDAIAAAEVLKYVLEKESNLAEKYFIRTNITATKLPDQIDEEEVRNLPDDCGLYYFLDQYDDIIYIGKSKNIQKRVKDHFFKNTRKSATIRTRTHSIKHEITGSELIALLRESEEIKEFQPEINRAQRQKSYPYVIYTVPDKKGYLNYKIEKWSNRKKREREYLHAFPSLKAAKGFLQNLINQCGLCVCLSNMDKRGAGCAFHEMGTCDGAGVGKVKVLDYNNLVEASYNFATEFFNEDFVIIENGRNFSERSIIGVKDGSYYGYAYIEADLEVSSFSEYFDIMDRQFANGESNRIIFRYLFENKNHSVIKEEIFAEKSPRLAH